MGLAELQACEWNTTQACQVVLAVSWTLHLYPQCDGGEGLGVSSKGPRASSEQEKGAYTSFSAQRAHIVHALSLLARSHCPELPSSL